MTGYRLGPSVPDRISEIYQYSKAMWGSDRAAAYVEGLFDTFEKIARRQVVWRPVPAEAGIQGYFVKYRSHVVYWRAASAQHVTIVSILHERMDQSSRLRRETQTWNDGDVDQ